MKYVFEFLIIYKEKLAFFFTFSSSELLMLTIMWKISICRILCHRVRNNFSDMLIKTR